MSSPISFQAIRIFEEDSKFVQRIIERSTEDLPEGEVLIQVHYSSLNYKDALSASGNRGVTRNYPHTPGVDASGIVAASTNPDFKAGDPVVVTSYDLGMNTDGGFGEYIRVPAAWVLPLPQCPHRKTVRKLRKVFQFPIFLYPVRASFLSQLMSVNALYSLRNPFQ